MYVSAIDNSVTLAVLRAQQVYKQGMTSVIQPFLAAVNYLNLQA